MSPDRPRVLRLVTRLKAHAASPRIVAYGSHVDAATLKRAREAGCDRVLPRSASSHQVQEQIRQNFASNESGATEVVAAGIGSPDRRRAEIDAYAARLSQLRGVARVDALTGSYIAGRVVATGPTNARFGGREGTWFSVVPVGEPLSETLIVTG